MFINLYFKHSKNYFPVRPDWVQWQGSKFCCGDFVWYGYHEELPKFGRVYDIIVVEMKAFLCLDVYFTKGIDRHYHSFIIEPTSNKTLYSITTDNNLIGWLHSLQAHSLRVSSASLYIVTKCITIKM